MPMRFGLLFLWFPLLLLCSGRLSATPVKWHAGNKTVFIDDKDFEILYDSTNTLSIEEILSRADEGYFEKSKKHPLVVSGNQPAVWIRFDIKNVESTESNFLMFIEYTALDSLEVFLCQNNKIVKRYPWLGRFPASDSSSYSLAHPLIQLSLVADQQYTLYLNLKDQPYTAKFPISLWNEFEFWKQILRQQYTKSIALGAILLIGVIALMRGFSYRWPIFIWYGVYVLSLFIFIINSTGQIAEMIPKSILWNNVYDLYVVFISVHYLANLAYLRTLLRAELARHHIFDQFLLALLLINFTAIVFISFNPLFKHHKTFLNAAMGIGNTIIFINLLLFIGLVILGFFYKNSLIRFYMVASVPFIMIIIFSRMVNLGIIRSVRNEGLTHLFLIGVLWDVGVMGYVMVRRIIAALPTTPTHLRESAQDTPSATDSSEGIIIHSNSSDTRVESSNGSLNSGDVGSVLTRRELEIITFYVSGLSYQQIADTLFVSPLTVRTHLKNIYNKLDIHDKTEAVQWAIKNEVI